MVQAFRVFYFHFDSVSIKFILLSVGFFLNFGFDFEIPCESFGLNFEIFLLIWVWFPFENWFKFFVFRVKNFCTHETKKRDFEFCLKSFQKSLPTKKKKVWKVSSAAEKKSASWSEKVSQENEKVIKNQNRNATESWTEIFV